MNPSRTLNRSFAAAVVLLTGTANCPAADAITDSFGRMLAHQPGQVMSVTGADREADPLLPAMVIPLLDRSPRPVAFTADPVIGSFARMLEHTPSPVTPAAPANLGPDPLVAAVVEPLRQWLSGCAAAPRFARAPAIGPEH